MRSRSAGTDYPAGSWILPAQDGLGGGAAAPPPRTWRSTSTSAADGPDVARHAARAPRLGVWVPWADTDTIGWLRYTLDQRRIPYSYVRDEDIRAGNAARRSTTCCSTATSTSSWPSRSTGLPKAWGPMPYKKTRSHAESWHARGVRRHHGRHRLGRTRADPAVRRGAAALLVTLGSGIRCSRSKAASCAACGATRRACRAAPRRRRRVGAGRASPSRARRGRTCASRSHGPIIRSRTAIPPRTHVFRQNFPLYDVAAALAAHGVLHDLPRRPGRPRGVVLRMGRPRTARRSWSAARSGARSEPDRPAGDPRPAGRAAATSSPSTSIPLHRDLNRGDQRLLWNAILNWEAIVKGRPDPR